MKKRCAPAACPVSIGVFRRAKICFSETGSARQTAPENYRDIKEQCRAEKITSQTMIVVSPALGARHWPELKKSKLYDAAFTHRFRRGVKTATR